MTGASGYVAGWIVKQLLEAGVTVHAAVRSPDAAEKIQHLVDAAAAAPGEIRFFAADLLTPGSYAEAMAGCATVFHTASPFTLDVRDPQRELVDPALLGTRNVLEQATATPSVRRVVLTSSIAAIYSDNSDLADAPRGVFDETIWNTNSSLTHNPYYYSKTVAEAEAWKIVETQSAWDLVVINPTLVLGPSVSATTTSESFRLVKQFGDGVMKMGAPRVSLGVVDVRDVAAAHLAAAFRPAAAGRYIVNAENTDFLTLARALEPRFAAYPLPRRAMPKWLIWLVGPMINAMTTRRYVSLNVDLPFRADNAKSVRELGLVYRPARDAINEMFEQMIETGVLPRR